MESNNAFHLITIIAQHKFEKKVLQSLEEAGSPGATFFYGQGTGVRQRLGFIGRFIEQEKVVILAVVPEESKQKILKIAEEAASIEKAGQGMVFSTKISDVKGYLK